jgi:PKD repeat protein
MKNLSLKQLGIKLGLLAVLALPELAGAQIFNYPAPADLLLGVRQPSTAVYELVVDIGNITNFVAVPAGTTINVTNFTTTQLTNAFTSLANLQWSVFGTYLGSGGRGGVPPLTTPFGSVPNTTVWLTLPSTNVAAQTSTPPPRPSDFGSVNANINGVGSGAVYISSQTAASTNNTSLLVRESVSSWGGPNGYTLTVDIGDSTSSSNSDFAGIAGSGGGLGYNIEATTPNPFSSAQRADLYEVCPSGQTDPLNSSTTTSAFIGYFILNSNGTMTFTAASSTPPAPVAGSVTSTVTNGFGPLTAIFTNTASGSITNWIWNFGNGTIITNTTGANVTNTYAAGGPYTVTLTVNGAGGSSTNILTSYIVASPTPSLGGVTRSGGNLVFGGSNCPAGVQYRILTATNLTTALTNWVPVWTNTFLGNGTFSYTNPATTNSAFFRMVSP